MKLVDFSVLFAFYLPLLWAVISDWDFLKKAKRISRGGYVYAILLPILFIYIAFDTFDVFKYKITGELVFVLSIFVTAIARLLSNKIYISRISRLKIKKGEEKWIVNRFYRDILYSIFLSLPGSLTYLILNLDFLRVLVVELVKLF